MEVLEDQLYEIVKRIHLNFKNGNIYYFRGKNSSKI